MLLSPGTTLGSYKILASIGAGGMGEVYRAQDTRLGREVAVKVSAERFSDRFERESRVIASLNHPNICTLHDVGPNYLVMELVEGPTLADRIDKGALPLEEALGIARKIGEALDAAHQKRVVHRDLKPQNVKITADGGVKVLDFGLAKTGEEPKSGDNLENSPTLTVGVHTAEGLVLGTAAYMAPEQARGRTVDKRADIWAFGVVLYEMLTGRRLFDGESVTDILSAVLTREPEWELVPPKARRLLRSCLEKDPSQRLRDIGDAWRLLEEAPPTVATRKQPWALVSVLLAILLLAGFSGLTWLRTPLPQPSPVSRWTVPLAAGDPGNGYGIAISRDGTRMAYAERSGSSSRIVIRILDQMDASPIQGTEGGLRPFFSPDGKWIVYFSGLGGPIKKVSAAGGAAVTLCEDASYFGGSWGEDDRIVFTANFGTTLMRVPAGGGKCETLATPDRQKGETSYRWPQLLPGGRSLLITIGMGGSFDRADLAVLDLTKQTRRVLVKGATEGRYVPSGHLTYVRGGTLYAVPFDLDRLSIGGGEMAVLDGLFYNSSGGFADYAFSNSGVLLYMMETRRTNLYSFDWADRKGVFQSSSIPPREGHSRSSRHGSSLRLSPDGQQAAMIIASPAGALPNPWVADLSRGTLNRINSEATSERPVWTPDGKRVAFFSSVKGAWGIYWAPADGSAMPELLIANQKDYSFPSSWTPDGKTLLYESLTPARIWAYSLPGRGGDGKPRLLFETTSATYQGQAQLSADGQWVAYVSDESGKNQVYVRQFPGGGGRTQISIDGGEDPRWSHDGSEIFYLDLAKNQVMAVDILRGPPLRAGQPHALFEHRLADWDVTPDGKRFLLRRIPQTEQGQARLQVVVNWFEELRQKAPAGK